MLVRLMSLARGDNRDSAPISKISFPIRLSEKFARLTRLARGDKRD